MFPQFLFFSISTAVPIPHATIISCLNDCNSLLTGRLNDTYSPHNLFSILQPKWLILQSLPIAFRENINVLNVIYKTLFHACFCSLVWWFSQACSLCDSTLSFSVPLGDISFKVHSAKKAFSIALFSFRFYRSQFKYCLTRKIFLGNFSVKYTGVCTDTHTGSGPLLHFLIALRLILHSTD